VFNKVGTKKQYVTTLTKTKWL